MKTLNLTPLRVIQLVEREKPEKSRQGFLPQNCHSEQWGHQSHIPKWIYGKRHIGDKQKYFTVKNGAIPTGNMQIINFMQVEM